MKFTTQTVFAESAGDIGDGGSLDGGGQLQPGDKPDGGNGSSSGGGSGSGGSGGGSDSSNNSTVSKSYGVAYNNKYTCSDYGMNPIWRSGDSYNYDLIDSWTGIAPTSAMKTHVLAKIESAKRSAIAQRLPGNYWSDVCTNDAVVRINITEHEDTTRAPAAWKYIFTYASKTGVKNPNYNRDNLIFDEPYTHFFTYSDEMIQTLIDEGYFDYLLPNNGGPTKESKEEARKDLNKSELKEWYKERDYPSEVIQDGGSWTTKRSIFLNPYYWHRSMLYYKNYLYDWAEGLITASVIGTDKSEERFDSNPGYQNAVRHKGKLIYRAGYYNSKNNWRACTSQDVNAHNTNCVWLESKYEYYWTVPVYTTTYKGNLVYGITNYEATQKTTDWKYYDRWIGYIEPGDNPKPPSENDFVCPLVFPKAVNAKNCRAYYRDGTIPRGSSKAEMDKGCPCSKLTNLTD